MVLLAVGGYHPSGMKPQASDRSLGKTRGVYARMDLQAIVVLVFNVTLLTGMIVTLGACGWSYQVPDKRKVADASGRVQYIVRKP